MGKKICNGKHSLGRRAVGVIAVSAMTMATIIPGSGRIEAKTTRDDNGEQISSEGSILTGEIVNRSALLNGAEYVDNNITNRTIVNSNIIGGNVSNSHLKNEVLQKNRLMDDCKI